MWVLDASAVLKWFFADEPLRTQALELRSCVAGKPEQFAVPSLLHSELLHVLARKSDRNEAFVSRSFELILRMGIRSVALSEKALRRAGQLACKPGMSGYDATYLALAEDLKGVWITADARAVKAAASDHALLLADWPNHTTNSPAAAPIR